MQTVAALIPSQNQGQQAIGAASGQLVNTNLEQISDWLTKIIVGLGLTQLSKLPGLVRWLSNFVAIGIVIPRLGATETQASAFAAGMFVYFTGNGFTGGYLLTRLILAGLFQAAVAEGAPDAAVAPANPQLTVEPASIPQKQPTDVTVSSTTAILAGAILTAEDPGVVIGPPSVNRSDASHLSMSITLPGQGEFGFRVRPDASFGVGNLEVKVTGQ